MMMPSSTHIMQRNDVDSSSSSSSMQFRVSTHQTLSLFFTYSRLPGLLLAPVITVFMIPLIFLFLNFITSGHAVHSILLAVAFYRFGVHLIHSLARSPDALEKALARNDIPLLLIPLALSTFLIILLIRTTGGIFPWESSWERTLAASARVAATLFILQVAVLLRYFCPPAIMRCSSVPLLTNPYDSSIRYFLKYPLHIAEPSDAPGSWVNHSTFPAGRRYQYPALLSNLMQLVVCHLLGYILYAAVWQSVMQDRMAASLTACMLIPSTPIYFYFHQKNHEIDPRRYLCHHIADWLTDTAVLGLKTAATTGSVIVAISLSAALTWPESTSSDGISWSVVLRLSLLTFLSLWTLFTGEEVLRLVLFCPRIDITKDLLEIMESSHTKCVVVILQSFLLDSTIVDSVCRLPMTTKGFRLEDMEQRLVLEQCEAFRRLILDKIPNYVEAPLEEDVFRFAVIEALGGTDDHVLRGRHAAITKEWLSVGAQLAHGGGPKEPPVATLVRGLCVMIGGMGDALAFVASLTGGTRRSVDTWELSVGGLLQLQCTLVALKRIFQTKSPPMTTHHLDALVPAALTCLHKLNFALRRYRVSKDHVDLVESVLRSCDLAAACIVHRAAVLARPLTVAIASLNVDRQVMNWLKTLEDLVSSGEGFE